MRQEDLDELVWREILRLLEDSTLIQNEIDRRLQEAKNSDPQRQREEILRREQTRLHNAMERLLTAYQEDLVPLHELRQRMPELRRQQQALNSEIQCLQMAVQDQSRYLQLVQSLNHFRDRLRAQANQLDVLERQKILRLLVREVMVGADSIVIRHCIRLPQPTPTPTCSPTIPSEAPDSQSYLLRMWRNSVTSRVNIGGNCSVGNRD